MLALCVCECVMMRFGRRYPASCYYYRTMWRSLHASRRLLVRTAVVATAATGTASVLSNKDSRLSVDTSSSGCGFGFGRTSVAYCDFDANCGVDYESGHTLMNWSSTHQSSPHRIYHPKSPQEVVRVLQWFNQHAYNQYGLHNKTVKIRPIGTGLSPNGIALTDNHSNLYLKSAAAGRVQKDLTCTLSLSELDSIRVDARRREVTVGAGAKVSAVLAELAKHGLTLSNFSSIQEQQVGGWTQVSAHGTGCRLSTVDEMIVRMQLATPTEGLMTLSESSNKDLFKFAKVGLGCLGVVTELTFKCMPQLSLLEETAIFNRETIEKEHVKRLRDYRHVRYMWIPFTDTVVSVVSNPAAAAAATPKTTAINNNNNNNNGKNNSNSTVAAKPATEPLSQLVYDLKLLPKTSRADIDKLSFAQLRDILLDHAPLDVEHIKRVNNAEAEFWTRSAGQRVEDSTVVLGFDCGGEQWVLEVCFPIGRLSQQPSDGPGKDVQFVKKLLKLVESANIAAPSPVEQRWSAQSSAVMSPCHSRNKVITNNAVIDGEQGADDDPEVFSWVGIIMYLPPNQGPASRAAITRAFDEYTALMEPLMTEYDAHVHWAKIELPGRGASLPTEATAAEVAKAEPVKTDSKKVDKKTDKKADKKAENKSAVKVASGGGADDSQYARRLQWMQERIRQRYPVKEFNALRHALDPNNILGNDLIDTLLADEHSDSLSPPQQ
jgi:L-galactono-1,4-lactone dehydrogenase